MQQSLSNIIEGIVDDLKTLMRQEFRLFQDEVKLEVAKVGRAAAGFGIAIALGFIAGLFLLFMLVHGLHEWTSLPLWSCYGIVAIVLLAIAIMLAMKARSVVITIHTTPARTLYSIKENAQWIKKQLPLSRT